MVLETTALEAGNGPTMILIYQSVEKKLHPAVPKISRLAARHYSN
jgi:hypothetical protein